MTSNEPGACCTRGFKHEGEGRGRMVNVGDVEAYAVEPESESVSNGYGVV